MRERQNTEIFKNIFQWKNGEKLKKTKRIRAKRFDINWIMWEHLLLLLLAMRGAAADGAELEGWWWRNDRVKWTAIN